MKHVRMLILISTILSFISCSKDGLKEDYQGIGSIKINVMVSQQNLSSLTRVVSPVHETTPIINSATVFVVRNTRLIAEKTIVIKNGIGSVLLKEVPLRGNEVVYVSANSNLKEMNGLNISTIQPTSDKGGVDNIVYYNRVAVSSLTPKFENGVAHYTVEDLKLKPVAARVELSGNIKYNNLAVTNVTVDVVTPNGYSTNYGNPKKFFAKFSPQAVANKGVLVTEGDAFYAQIKDKKSVLAYHLFEEDEQRISFRIKTTMFDAEKNVDGSLKLLQAKNERGFTYTSPVYRGTNGQLYVLPTSPEESEWQNVLNAGSLEKQGAGLHVVTKDSEGKYIVGQRVSSDVRLGRAENKGFFSLVNFGTDVAGKLSPLDDGKYVAGSIYKIDFERIDWNGDGIINDKDVYDPTINGGGTENPELSINLVAAVKVVDWTIENLDPIIE